MDKNKRLQCYLSESKADPRIINDPRSAFFAGYDYASKLPDIDTISKILEIVKKNSKIIYYREFNEIDWCSAEEIYDQLKETIDF